MNKGIALVEGLAILFIMQFLGELLTRILHLPLPGNLTGLILLFLSLILGVVKVNQVEDAVDLLLDNMMLLLIPLNVGLMVIFPLLKREGLAIILSILISTLLVMIITAKTIEILNKVKGAGKKSAI